MNSNAKEVKGYKAYGAEYQEKYEEALKKWSGKLEIDIDWLRKASYNSNGQFLTYGEHYNNICNFISKRDTNSYIYLKDFKFRLISPYACIEALRGRILKNKERLESQKEGVETDKDVDLDGIDAKWAQDLNSFNTEYHHILWDDISLTKNQKALLDQVLSLECSEEERIMQCLTIPKKKVVLAGGIAKIIKVTIGEEGTREEFLGCVTYDIDYTMYKDNPNDSHYKKPKSSGGAFKYLPKTIKTRTMREALKKVYMHDFEMMENMASLETIDEIEVAVIESMQENNTNSSEVGLIPSLDIHDIAKEKLAKIKEHKIGPQLENKKEDTKEAIKEDVNDPFNIDQSWVAWEDKEMDTLINKTVEMGGKENA